MLPHKGLSPCPLKRACESSSWKLVLRNWLKLVYCRRRKRYKLLLHRFRQCLWKTRRNLKCYTNMLHLSHWMTKALDIDKDWLHVCLDSEDVTGFLEYHSWEFKGLLPIVLNNLATPFRTCQVFELLFVYIFDRYFKFMYVYVAQGEVYNPEFK